MLLPTIQSVSSKGQFVIPSAFRKMLGISEGTKLIVSVDEAKSKLIAKPVPHNPIKAAFGILRQTKRDRGAMKRMLKEKYAEIARGE